MPFGKAKIFWGVRVMGSNQYRAPHVDKVGGTPPLRTQAISLEYFTKQEAADYLRVSRSNLESYINEIPHFRLGKKEKGKVIFRRTDLDKWIESYRIEHPITKNQIDQEVDEILKQLQTKA